jgi:hypothetical protein
VVLGRFGFWALLLPLSEIVGGKAIALAKNSVKVAVVFVTHGGHDGFNGHGRLGE